MKYNARISPQVINDDEKYISEGYMSLTFINTGRDNVTLFGTLVLEPNDQLIISETQYSYPRFDHVPVVFDKSGLKQEITVMIGVKTENV